MKKILLVAVFSLFYILSYTQSSPVSIHSEDEYLLQRFEVRYGNTQNLHVSHQGYDRKTIAEFAYEVDSSQFYLSKADKYNVHYLMNDNTEWVPTGEVQSKKPVLKYFYTTPANLYSVNVKDFSFEVNPVIQFSGGYAKQTSGGIAVDNGGSLFVNTRGLELRGVINKKIGFYTYATDNQMREPVYYQELIRGDPKHPDAHMPAAVPGEGYFKIFHATGVDYFDARGNVQIEAAKYVHAELGYGKNFIGDGYRSLFLSDYGPSYLYLKLNTRIWKFDYQNIFTEFIAHYNGPYIKGSADTLLDKKYGAFHHLSLNVNKNLNFGAFEGIIFHRKTQFELQYLVPVIFYRSVEQQLGSPDNAMIGVDGKYNFLKHVQVYGQLLIDDLNIAQLRSTKGWWGNKYGIQLGAKYYDIAGVSNLDGQVEMNRVRPYTYSHFNNLLNYASYNQPLAHPLGANFSEMIGILRYKPMQNLILQGKLIYAIEGTDGDSTDWGGNIFLPYTNHEQDYGNVVGQGVRNTIRIADLLVSYEVKHNIYLDLDILLRNANSAIDTRDRDTKFVNVGFRMNLPYKSNDF